MIHITRALEVDCPTCGRPHGSLCVGVRFHRARVIEAARVTREANRAARERDAGDTPGCGRTFTIRSSHV